MGVRISQMTSARKTAALSLAPIIAIALIFGIYLNLSLQPPQQSTQTSSTWQVVNTNVTVYGLAAGQPCGALRLPCATYPNQSISAQIVSYGGRQYYVSQFTLENDTIFTVFTIWYDNSTSYCTTPKLPWENACPVGSYISPSTAISCSKSYQNGTDVGVAFSLPQKSDATATLCVRFYYFNSTSPIVINASRQFTIYSPLLRNVTNGELFNLTSSFLVTPSIASFLIGGPQNENEGFEVNYTVQPIVPVPSGTYEIALWSGFYPQNVICGYGIYVYLQFGNLTNPIIGSSCHYVPAPNGNPGLVYTEVVGVTNST
jgi:hypothetical protein